MTSLANSWTNFNKSLGVCVIAATAQNQRARSYFSASALFSERLRGAARSVKIDIIASLSLHVNIAEITAQELSLSYIVYYLLEIDRYIGLPIFLPIFKHFTIIGFRFCKKKNWF